MFLATWGQSNDLKPLVFGPFTLDPQLAPGESRPLNEVELIVGQKGSLARDKKALTTQLVQLEALFISVFFTFPIQESRPNKRQNIMSV